MKTRPNEPCPCGSGVKYKKCHGAPDSHLQDAKIGSMDYANWLDRARLEELNGRLDSADRCYQRAIQLAPARPDAWFGLGKLAERAGDIDTAETCYGELLRRQPRHALALFALGNLHARAYRFDRARACYERAIEIDSALVGAWTNLGNIHKYQGRFREALVCYHRAIELDLDFESRARRHSHYLFSLHYDENLTHEAIYTAHREWAELYASRFYPGKPRWENAAHPDKRLRVGYVSGSFDGQIMGHFLLNVLTRRDRERFETVLYSSTRVYDAHTDALRQTCDEWVDIANLDDAQAAERMHTDGVDILVDLDSHTQKGRPLIFARKPAPVQVEWLDYFNTSGMQVMNYIISDPYTTPEGSPQRFSEELVRLPHSRFCYAPVDYAPAVADTPRNSGAPLTFGSFNRQDKLHPVLLRRWAEILLAVPEACLLLKNRALQVEAVCRYLRKLFASYGISPERLILRGPSPHAAMLAEYADIDIALDTFPYNGGLTTCECLWMGVPIVALEAERMIGRQTAAMLRLLGLGDWIASSESDYVRLAIEKSRDVSALAAVRASIRPRMAASPLCDSARFARDLEAAYRTMWRQYCANRTSEGA